MADRLRRVASAFHAAQVADPEDVRKQVALEAREKFAGLFLVGQVAGAQPHQRRPRPEVVELLGVRLVVDAVDRLDASPLDFLRDSLVGQQHEFLDQLVRHVVLHPAHLAQSALGIEQHLVLRHVEIQRARPEARLPQFLREAMGVVQHALDVAGRFATEDRHRLLIRKTAFRADNRRVKLRLLDLPVPAQHKLHAARQPIHPRLERAQLVAQFLGQHRDDAVNEIRRVAALPRLLVESALWGDVVRHVGDVHPQPPAPPLDALQRNGVVEVTRIDRVNRHDAVLAAIPAAFAVGLRHFRAQAPGLGLDLAREARRQLVLPDDRLDIDARRAWAADHLEQFALRRVVARRPLGDLDHHPVAATGLGLGLLAKLGQINVVCDARVARHDVPKLPRLLQRADHLRAGALEHLDHPAAWPRRRAPATVLSALGRCRAIHQHQHSVVVHRGARGVGRDVDRGLRRVGGDDPSAAPAVHQDSPGDQVLVARQRETLVGQPHHPAQAHEVA